jgi:hypothetical protein
LAILAGGATLALSLRRGPIYSDKLSGNSWRVGHDGMDSSGLAEEVRIKRADDNPGMSRPFPVETDEVFPGNCEDGPILFGGVREHLLICHALSSLAGSLDGEDVVAQAAKFEHDRQWKVLVGVEAGHAQAASLS